MGIRWLVKNVTERMAQGQVNDINTKRYNITI